ncbi:acyl-CoA dehydrogenase family protein [Microbacterium profundi]|uniref:Acyl-CoA dehydrogenase family protein n=1 Tax=Microbacterium profundi TaxID=450380 RepID=A0ABV3LD45_9MICO
MRYTFSAEQQAFGESADALFRKVCTGQGQRELWSTETGRDVVLWEAIAELGAPAIIVPEENDGIGGTEADLVPFFEAVGYHAVPDALVEAVFVGPFAITAAGSRSQRERWLPLVASGELRVTIALEEGALVPDAHVSDLILLARDGELWAHTRDGLELQARTSQDPSRRLFSVRAMHTGERLPGSRAALAKIEARQLVGSAAVLNGISKRLLEDSVAYAQTRKQFDRVVGSFQAVKHLLADVASHLPLATAATRAAAVILGTDTVAGIAAAEVARIVAVETEFLANHTALQVHGGVGFTFEVDLQIWLKRGKVLENAHGGSRAIARRAGMRAVLG